MLKRLIGLLALLVLAVPAMSRGDTPLDCYPEIIVRSDAGLVYGNEYASDGINWGSVTRFGDSFVFSGYAEENAGVFILAQFSLPIDSLSLYGPFHVESSDMVSIAVAGPGTIDGVVGPSSVVPEPGNGGLLCAAASLAGLVRRSRCTTK